MLGIIDATTYNKSLHNLTKKRSMAAIPFGGRYRLIDFVLSNMVNSEIESVAIFPKYQYRSLMDHLGSGKEWDLNRKRDGLFFFPSPNLDESSKKFGSFKQFENHIEYFLRSTQKYVVIANSYTVCNIDFQTILDWHIEEDCDITEVRHNGRSLEMFILKTSLLLNFITNHEKSGYESIFDVVKDYQHNLKICHYDYNGYAAVIDSMENYYLHSLKLLNPDIWKQLFLQSSPILTKVKDEPPTRYVNGSVVKNSMIANGCVIEGQVENSIIFRGVKIAKGTVIKNSIVMQKSQIGENCVLDTVILDKDVKVENNVRITSTGNTPHVICKGTIQGVLMNS